MRQIQNGHLQEMQVHCHLLALLAFHALQESNQLVPSEIFVLKAQLRHRFLQEVFKIRQV